MAHRIPKVAARGVNALAFNTPANFSTAVMIASPSTYTFVKGGLNSSGCSGSGNFYCFDANTAIRRRGRRPVSDNGTELTSNAILSWADETGAGWHYIAPGKPQQNGFIAGAGVPSKKALTSAQLAGRILSVFGERIWPLLPLSRQREAFDADPRRWQCRDNW
jgi:hypothetical protein